jgi:hypothetical protein
MPALRPVVSSPLPSEPDLRVPPHPALDEHWSGRPLVQLPLSVKYPLPVTGSSAPVFTGDLLPSNRAAGSLDPFALQAAFPPSLVARDCHDYYESSTTPRRQQRTVRLPQTPDCGLGGHRRDASHVHSSTGWQGRHPAVPRGHRRALPQPGTRPRPSEQSSDGRDGPEQQPGPITPAAHSRQFPG